MRADELLLHAAFGTRERCVAAWDEWSSGRDLSALDPTQTRLFPAVYRNLRASGVADAKVPPAVKEMARALWIRTELLLREAAATTESLRLHGIEPILLKGAALVAGGFSESSARPMSDFDLLVRPSEVQEVAALLRRAGWNSSANLDRELLLHRHSLLFSKGEHGCDLHWRPLWESHEREADERMRADAEVVSMRGTTVRIPRPEDLLLLVIIHGTRAMHPAVRWIGDALAILRARAGDFDWHRLVREADARRLAFPLGDALAYLADEFGANVPPAPRALQSRSVRFGLRSMYEVRPHVEIGRWRALAATFMVVSVRCRPLGLPLRDRILWFPRSLRYGFGVRLKELPLKVLRFALRRSWRA